MARQLLRFPVAHLELTIDELPDAGEIVPLGEQTIALSSVIVINPNRPDGKAEIEVLWGNTLSLNAGSLVLSCSTVVLILPNGQRIQLGPTTCVELDPQFP